MRDCWARSTSCVVVTVMVVAPVMNKHCAWTCDLSGGGVLARTGDSSPPIWLRHLLGGPTQVRGARGISGIFPEVETTVLLLKVADSMSAQIMLSTNPRQLDAVGQYLFTGNLWTRRSPACYGTRWPLRRQKLVWGKRQPNHGRPDERVFEFPLPDDSMGLRMGRFH